MSQPRYAELLSRERSQSRRRAARHLARRDDPLTALYKERVENNRDLKCIITQRNSETGGGKSTLAVSLAQKWDRTPGDWTADEGTLDPNRYGRLYRTLPEGSALVLDEAEQAADSRRSMSANNVELSHLWATMRYREIYTIVTLPTQSMLDKRLKELADLRINVTARGNATVYRVTVDDHTGKIWERKMAEISWNSLDGFEPYEELSRKKADRMETHDTDDPADPKTIRRDTRDELIRDMYDADGLTQEEIAEIVDLDRSTVSKIVG